MPIGAECAMHQWHEHDHDLLLPAGEKDEDEMPSEHVQSPASGFLSELDEESKKNLSAVFANCLSARQRQIYYLHHGILGNLTLPMKHRQIAKKLNLLEAEVDEIFYQAEMVIRKLRDNLDDVLESKPTPAHRALHAWVAN